MQPTDINTIEKNTLCVNNVVFSIMRLDKQYPSAPGRIENVNGAAAERLFNPRPCLIELVAYKYPARRHINSINTVIINVIEL